MPRRRHSLSWEWCLQMQERPKSLPRGRLRDLFAWLFPGSYWSRLKRDRRSVRDCGCLKHYLLKRGASIPMETTERDESKCQLDVLSFAVVVQRRCDHRVGAGPFLYLPTLGAERGEDALIEC